MRLYDSRIRSVGTPTFSRTVRMYVCGITPYDATHLGHAFTYSAFDVLARVLGHAGHRVLVTRNVTDVDDDILRKARAVGEDPFVLGEREMARLVDDLRALGLADPDHEPRVSTTIPAIRRAVAGLLEAGSAYALTDGRVYFDTAAAPTWNAMARLDPDEMLRQFTEKGGDPDAAGKRSTVDFLLWQPSGEDEPGWPHPVDPTAPRGRPGWHIECSVMAAETLGTVVDVHGGGSDLVFPHHEAEIQQAEHLSGQGPFARVWMHVAMVAMDGEKMSKSLGNLVFVRDLRKDAPGGAIRRHLVEHQYRAGWEWDPDAFAESVRAHAAWSAVAADAAHDPGLDAGVVAALRDDLDTPTAVALLDDATTRGLGGSVRSGAALLGVEL